MRGLDLLTATSADELFVRDLMIRTTAEELAAWAWPEPMRSQLLDVQYRGRVDGIRSAWPGSIEQLIWMSGNPVGRLVVLTTPDEVRILDLAVLPKHRNAGIGAAALRQWMEEANRTARPVRLSVNTSNPALRLYEREGFVKVGGNEVQHHLEWTPSLRNPATDPPSESEHI